MALLPSLSVGAQAMPKYLRDLPWACEDGGDSDMAGLTFENLSVCKPNGAPKVQAFVQRVADAMGNAGHPPRLRFGPLGPHLYAIDGATMISATFVQAEGKFDVWISIQTQQAEPSLPPLPRGVEWVTAHREPSGQRLLAMHVDSSLRDSQSLVDATFLALGIKALSAREMDAPLPTKSGELAWAKERGFYHLVEIDAHTSYLTIYAGAQR